MSSTMLVSTLLDFNYTASCRSSNILGLRRKPVDIINLARNIAKQGGSIITGDVVRPENRETRTLTGLLWLKDHPYN